MHGHIDSDSLRITSQRAQKKKWCKQSYGGHNKPIGSTRPIISLILQCELLLKACLHLLWKGKRRYLWCARSTIVEFKHFLGYARSISKHANNLTRTRPGWTSCSWYYWQREHQPTKGKKERQQRLNKPIFRSTLEQPKHQYWYLSLWNARLPE